MASQQPTSEPAPRIVRLLSDAAIIWGIVSLLLVLLLAGAHYVLLARYGGTRIFDHHSRLTPVQRAVYGPGWSDADLDDMLSWTWSPGWIYEPWVAFREKPRTSRFVNVSQDGVRLTKGGAAGLADVGDNAVFVFGGSTMFGYGVADSETVASHLQELAGSRWRVFNLGRAFYYSAQENVLFDSLARAGVKPAVAVFVDGLNERCDLDVYQKELAAEFARAQGEYQWGLADVTYPFAFIARKVRKVLGAPEPGAVSLDLHRLDCEHHGRRSSLAHVLEENLSRRERLCTEFGVRCVTVLQPIAGVHGEHPDRSQHSEEARAVLKRKFEHMLPVFRAHRALDATGALEGIGPAYVDGLHYSSKAGAAIAALILPSLDPTTRKREEAHLP